MRKIILIAACLATTIAAAQTGDYPARPIRIVVGFTPGGGPDITARFIAQKLAESWPQNVVVDNRPGAGGTIAAQLVAHANPDGYTLLSVSSAHAVAPAIYANLPYDARKDFAGITLTASSKYLLVVAPALGVKSVADLVALAKARPGQLNFSSAGVGSGTHFAGEQFKSMAAINVVHVPFKGIPEALTETMSGRVQFFMAPIANAVNLVKEGRLTALGVTSLQRDPLVPDVPSVAEAGVPGYQSRLWFGLLTARHVPRAVVARLNGEITRILSAPDVRSRWAPLGLDPEPTTPEQFDKLIIDEIAAFTSIARAANIKAE